MIRGDRVESKFKRKGEIPGVEDGHIPVGIRSACRRRKNGCRHYGGSRQDLRHCSCVEEAFNTKCIGAIYERDLPLNGTV